MGHAIVRPATLADSPQVFDLTRQFATSFQPQIEPFEVSFRSLLTQEDARLLVACESDQIQGYLLGFDHYTLFANGRVAWVEEIMIRPDRRRQRLGAELMFDFERWAVARGCALSAVATRRASDFYLALGYQESAAYFRKLL